MKKLPLIVIVGPTASGKTGLAIRLAKRFGGEIICADSRTVYKDMNIGTAKPSVSEQAGVPHWGLDLVDPTQKITAKQFQSYAVEKIEDIRQRGKIPFLVGGTGLYVDAVIYQYDFPTPIDEKLRKELEELSPQELYDYCIKNNIELPINDKNKRHLIRAIGHNGQSPKRRDTLADNTIVVGISTDKQILLQRIHDRTEEMFSNGVVDEAVYLVDKYGWDSEAMTSNVYRSLRPYLEGVSTIDEAKDQFKTRDWQLAKRQLTWFRRNKNITWLPLEEAHTYLARELAMWTQS